MRHLRSLFVAAAVVAVSPAVMVAAQPAPATAPTANAEDARLTAFLDAEFAQDLKLRPQLATRLGIKEGEDRLDDISDAGQLQRLEARRASVARMKAQFDRAKLSPNGQTNYDMWETELRAGGAPVQVPPLPAAVLFLPLFGALAAAGLHDQHPYGAATPPTCGPTTRGCAPSRRCSTRRSRRANCPMRRGARPKFQVERVIGGSTTLITGAPFDGGHGLAAVGRRQGQGRQAPGGRQGHAGRGGRPARRRRGRDRSDSKPAYERVIAWAQGELPDRAERPGRRDFAARAARTGTPPRSSSTPRRPHRRPDPQDRPQRGDPNRGRAGRARPPGRVQGPQRLLRRSRRRFPPQPWTDALRADYLQARQRGRSRTIARCCRSASTTCRTIASRWFASRRSARSPAAPPTPPARAPTARGRAASMSTCWARPRTRRAVYRPDVPRRHSRPRDGGRHPGAPDGHARSSAGPAATSRSTRAGRSIPKLLCKEMGAYPDVAVGLHAPRRRAVPRRAPGRRHRHPRQGLDRGPGRRLHDQDRPPRRPTRRARKSAATSRFPARRPATRSACSRSWSCAARPRPRSGRSSTSRPSTI